MNMSELELEEEYDPVLPQWEADLLAEGEYYEDEEEAESFAFMLANNLLGW